MVLLLVTSCLEGSGVQSSDAGVEASIIDDATADAGECGEAIAANEGAYFDTLEYPASDSVFPSVVTPYSRGTGGVIC